MTERLSQTQESKNLRAEHLKEDVNPIIACVGTPEDYKDDPKIKGLNLSVNIPPRTHSVNIYGISNELGAKGFKSNGSESYVISPVDDFDKYSKDFYNCTGLIVAGREKGTGRTISFLSHQNPDHFLVGGNRENFTKDLRAQIDEIKNRCEDSTVDAVLFGGAYAKVRDFADSDLKSDMFIKEYIDSINLLAEEVKGGLGFEPTVIVGPKTNPSEDKVFYDNENRRLYLIRDKIEDSLDQGFMPSEIDERRKNWKPGKWSLPI